jgi:L-lactate dehydrogenase complex protein LldG
MVATDDFATAARDADASVTRTSVAEFPTALTDITRTRKPAVGTQLPFDGVSYEGTPVEESPTGVDLLDATTGVTAGRLGIADYGSVVLEERGQGEELLALYPELHVVVVAESDVVPDMPAAFEEIGADMAGRRADEIIATGPSATADMGAVVQGVHGPREVHVVLLEDR